jgi:TatA/E family protein of Tat protein translocase
MAPLALLDLFSGPEMLIVLLAVLIFFGGDKLPEFARGFGKTMRELRKAAGEVEREIKRVMEEAENTPPTAPPVQLGAPTARLRGGAVPHAEPAKIAAASPRDVGSLPPPIPPSEHGGDDAPTIDI